MSMVFVVPFWPIVGLSSVRRRIDIDTHGNHTSMSQIQLLFPSYCLTLTKTILFVMHIGVGCFTESPLLRICQHSEEKARWRQGTKPSRKSIKWNRSKPFITQKKSTDRKLRVHRRYIWADQARRNGKNNMKNERDWHTESKFCNKKHTWRESI